MNHHLQATIEELWERRADLSPQSPPTTIAAPPRIIDGANAVCLLPRPRRLRLSCFAFSAATSSRQVIAILREYYDAVGAAAAACGGTIKDQAGDGVLVAAGNGEAYPLLVFGHGFDRLGFR